MKWLRESISDGEIEALYKTAQRAWSEDTRFPLSSVYTPDSGQCYVTAFWLKERLGGHIGKKQGHYAWLSPEGDYILDLAAHTGNYIYEENDDFKSIEAIPNARTERFVKRANTIFDHLGSVLHLSLDVGDALPASEPERSSEIAQENDQQYYHDEPNYKEPEGDYNFVFANDAMEVSPFHDHKDLLAHTGVSPDHKGPMAMGHVMVTDGRATWEVNSNMNIKVLDKICKEYCRNTGWSYGGITNSEGEPISDEFSPKKSKVLHFVYDNKHLWVGRDTSSGLAIKSGATGEFARTGTIVIIGRRATVSPIVQPAIGSLYEWATDEGLILYAGNDNLMQVVPDMQEHDNYDPNPKNMDEHQYPVGPTDEREPSGIYRCPSCQRIFPNYHTYADHRRQEANETGEPNQEGHFPQQEENAIQDSHFTPLQPEVSGF